MVTGPLLLVIFVISIAFVLFIIIKLKLNPFIALLLTCILTGILVQMPLPQIAKNIATGFGNTLEGIGIVIGLGIILGRILSETHATDKIAHTMVKAVGEKYTPLAVTLVGYLVSIPVFMDAAFVILISIVKKLSNITKTSIVTLVSALSISLLTSHNLIIPTPGPVEVASNLKVNLGIFTLYALIVALPTVLIGAWLYGVFIGKHETRIADDPGSISKPEEIVNQPSTFLSFFTLLLPIILILLGSILSLILQKGTAANSFFSFIGDKNVALLISVIFAFFALKKYSSHSMHDIMMEAGEKSGMILLITGAGGAFGYVISSSGIGNYLVGTMSSWNVSIILTGFLLAAVLRGAQGSSTVALVTASAILGPIVYQSNVSPILIALAIAAGGNCLSLPNDSGFWVVTRFSDFELRETFKAWTLGATFSGVVALIIIMILSLLSNILPGLH